MLSRRGKWQEAERQLVRSVLPLSERHLRRILQLWIDHYNGGRPHMSLGPGFPVPLQAPPPHGATATVYRQAK